MKKILSIILTLTMMIGLSSSAFASTTATKALGEGTLAERVATIREHYGITVQFERGYSEMDLTQEAASSGLAKLETALPYLGKAFTKKILADYQAKYGTGLKVTISPKGFYGQAGYANSREGMFIYANLAQTHTPIHEFAHIWDYTKPLMFSEQLTEINGPYNGHVAGQYVSYYAATSFAEDFAETFMHMVYYGADAPNTASSGSILYNKKIFVLDYLIRDFGAGSNATRRAAAHMGIDLDTYAPKSPVS